MADDVFGRHALQPSCRHCQRELYRGFAKCHECGAIRDEFVRYARVIRDEITGCIFSGAETDVVLDSGHSMWAPYLLDMIDAGWLDDNLSFTELACQKHPFLKHRWPPPNK